MKKPRSWMNEMIERGVLVGVPDTDAPLPVPDGVILITDSETDPGLIVKFGRKDHPVRLLANEAGVLIASPDPTVRDGLGIDANNVVYNPISRAISEGISLVLLCVNPSSIGGMHVAMGTVELIDHMMRAGKVITDRFSGLLVGHVVHVAHDDGTWTNYYVSAVDWHAFYTTYEMETFGRLADGVDYEDTLSDGGRVTDPLFGQM